MDAAVLVIAATDGVMAQTRVRYRVLHAASVVFFSGAPGFGPPGWREKHYRFHQ